MGRVIDWNDLECYTLECGNCWAIRDRDRENEFSMEDKARTYRVSYSRMCKPHRELGANRGTAYLSAHNVVVTNESIMMSTYSTP